MISLLLVGIWLISLTVPEAKESRHELEPTRISFVVRQPSVLVFLLVVCLVQVAHGPCYVFFSIYLEGHGYSGTQTGLLWSLGVFAEVALFSFMYRILQIVSLRHILMFSVALGIIRWSLLACCVTQIEAVIFAQVLHAATFGSTHIAAIHFVHRYFSGRHRGKGQALYSSMSFGLGGMIGSYTSGVLWASYGAVTAYYAAAGLCLCAYFIAWRWLGGIQDLRKNFSRPRSSKKIYKKRIAQLFGHPVPVRSYLLILDSLKSNRIGNYSKVPMELFRLLLFGFRPRETRSLYR